MIDTLMERDQAAVMYSYRCSRPPLPKKLIAVREASFDLDQAWAQMVQLCCREPRQGWVEASSLDEASTMLTELREMRPWSNRERRERLGYTISGAAIDDRISRLMGYVESGDLLYREHAEALEMQSRYDLARAALAVAHAMPDDDASTVSAYTAWEHERECDLYAVEQDYMGEDC